MLAAPLGLDSVQSPPVECRSILCDFVASGSLPGLRWPDFSDYRTQVQNFYTTTYAYAWIHRGEASEQARAIIEGFKDAEAKGLNSEDYDGSRWADRLAALSQAGKPRSESDLAAFD